MKWILIFYLGTIPVSVPTGAFEVRKDCVLAGEKIQRELRMAYLRLLEAVRERGGKFNSTITKESMVQFGCTKNR